MGLGHDMEQRSYDLSRILRHPAALWLLCLGGASLPRLGSAFGGLGIIENFGKTCSLTDGTRPCGAGFTCGACLQKTNVDVVNDRSRECLKGVDGECAPCLLGDYCPAGSRNPALWTSMHICPEGSFCPNATHKEECAPGFFCPPGVFTYNSSILSEVNVTLTCPADKGLYCPESSTTFLNGCPAGWYCPTPSQKLECPKGSYCREFSVNPRKCPVMLTSCPRGSMAPGQPYAMILAILFVVGFFFMLYHWCLRRRKMKEGKEREEAIKMSKLANSTREIMGRLIGIPSYALPEKVPGFRVKQAPLTVEFDGLRLRVKEKAVLNNVSAKFIESQVTAIMGPSGCGKSSLLNTVSGRAEYGVVYGDILVNGRPGRMQHIHKETAFVPQDDTVFEELTVRENVMYSARLRLSADVDHDRRQTIIGGVLQVLGLEHIQHSVVGSVKKRGISGGQKKRVNIGMELVSDPTLVFLDEPTSGLGSTDTLVVMKALRSMAFLRRTVVAVIHQPRYEVFTLFHEVLLLGVGGYTVYFGDSSNALQYFEGLGFKLPLYANPADFFLDIIAGNAQRRDQPGFRPADLVDMWHVNKASVEIAQVLSVDEVQLPADLEIRIKKEWDLVDNDGSGSIAADELQPMLEELGVTMSLQEANLLISSLDDDGSGMLEYQEFLTLARKEYAMLKFNTFETEGDNDEDEGEDGNAAPVPGGISRRVSINTRLFQKLKKGRQSIGFVLQMRYFLERAAMQMMRTMTSVGLWDIVLVLLAGLVVGGITGNNWTFGDLAKDALLSTVTLGVLTTVSSLKLFGWESVMHAREARCGVSTLAYFVAKNVVNLADVVGQPSIYIAIYYSFLMPDMAFLKYWVVAVAVSWACTGMGILLSIVFAPGPALLSGVMWPLVAGVFLGGVDPALGSFNTAMRIISGASYTRWAVEVIVILEMEAQESYQTERIRLVYDKFGFDRSGQALLHALCFLAGGAVQCDGYWFDMWSLFVMGCGFRFLGWLVMTGYVGPALESLGYAMLDVANDMLGLSSRQSPAGKHSSTRSLAGAGSLVRRQASQRRPEDLEAGGGDDPDGEEDEDARLSRLLRSPSRSGPGTPAHRQWESRHVDRIIRQSTLGRQSQEQPRRSAGGSPAAAEPPPPATKTENPRPRVGAGALQSMEDEMRSMEAQLQQIKQPSGPSSRRSRPMAGMPAPQADADLAPPPPGAGAFDDAEVTARDLVGVRETLEAEGVLRGGGGADDGWLVPSDGGRPMAVDDELDGGLLSPHPASHSELAQAGGWGSGLGRKPPPTPADAPQRAEAEGAAVEAAATAAETITEFSRVVVVEGEEGGEAGEEVGHLPVARKESEAELLGLLMASAAKGSTPTATKQGDELGLSNGNGAAEGGDTPHDGGGGALAWGSGVSKDAGGTQNEGPPTPGTAGSGGDRDVEQPREGGSVQGSPGGSGGDDLRPLPSSKGGSDGGMSSVGEAASPRGAGRGGSLADADDVGETSDASASGVAGYGAGSDCEDSGTGPRIGPSPHAESEDVVEEVPEEGGGGVGPDDDPHEVEAEDVAGPPPGEEAAGAWGKGASELRGPSASSAVSSVDEILRASREAAARDYQLQRSASSSSARVADSGWGARTTLEAAAADSSPAAALPGVGDGHEGIDDGIRFDIVQPRGGLGLGPAKAKPAVQRGAASASSRGWSAPAPASARGRPPPQHRPASAPGGGVRVPSYMRATSTARARTEVPPLPSQAQGSPSRPRPATGGGRVPSYMKPTSTARSRTEMSSPPPQVQSSPSRPRPAAGGGRLPSYMKPTSAARARAEAPSCPGASDHTPSPMVFDHVSRGGGAPSRGTPSYMKGTTASQTRAGGLGR